MSEYTMLVLGPGMKIPFSPSLAGKTDGCVDARSLNGTGEKRRRVSLRHARTERGNKSHKQVAQDRENSYEQYFIFRMSSYVGGPDGTAWTISSRRRVATSGCSASMYIKKDNRLAVVSRAANKILKS